MSMAVRAADYHLLVDGQSLPVWPSLGHPQSFPMLMRDTLGVPVSIVAVSGLGWQQLDNDLATRVEPLMQVSPIPIYIMVGGTTQLLLGQDGEGIYNTEVAVATTVRAMDPNVLILGTTTTPSEDFTGQLEIQRADLNDRVMADAAGAFDLKVDLAGDPRLDDPTDAAYYPDGTHPSYPLGTGVIAELLSAPIIAAVG